MDKRGDPAAGRETLIHLERRIPELLQERVTRLLLQAACGSRCHLVGGGLRDTALGLPVRDLDFIVEAGGRDIARRLGSSLPARLVELGGDRFAAWRLVADGLTIDLWDRAGSSLEADLRRRDLTIHSFAVDLLSGLVIDPFGGLGDLQNRALRATTADSFHADPLRVLRLARFAGQLPGFVVEPSTVTLARQEVRRVTEVAAERVRQELELAMDQAGADQTGRWLVTLGLYPRIWLAPPGGGAASAEPIEAGELRQRLHALESLANRLDVTILLPTARLALLFALLQVRDSSERLAALQRFQGAGFVTKATAKSIGQLLQSDKLPRERPDQRWFLHQQGRLWPTAVCLLGAAAAGPPGSGDWHETAASIKDEATRSATEIFSPRPLVSGHDLQKELGMPPGSELGQILNLVFRRQIEGRITSRDEALAFADHLRLVGSPGDTTMD
jgi:tRNA nucleotidyltransferase (CCA-adding enzyme)